VPAGARAAAPAVQIVQARVPQSHLFGARVTAVLELAVDTRRLDPAAIGVVTDFAPYRPAGPPRRTQTVHGTTALVRIVYPLQCLEPACRARRTVRLFRFAPARVEEGKVTLALAEWPPLRALSRIDAGDVQRPAPHATPTVEEAPSLALDPQLLAGLGIGGAAALALGGAWLLVGLRPGRRPAAPVDLDPLERALRRVEEADDPDELRPALDVLARALSDADAPALAAAAQQLAWAEAPPARAAMQALVDAARREAA
jgi:hypothetical protein